MAITATIQELLQGIMDSQYGRDMRQFIHDAIQKCYEEGSAGETDLVARERLDTVEDKIDNVLDNFGTVETTGTASKAYKKGDTFIYEDRLYKATTAIAQGDTLTVGVNMVESAVASMAINPPDFSKMTQLWDKDQTTYLHTCANTGWYMLCVRKSASDAESIAKLAVDVNGTMTNIAEVYNTSSYESRAMTPWFYFEEGQVIQCGAKNKSTSHVNAVLWYAPCL